LQVRGIYTDYFTALEGVIGWVWAVIVDRKSFKSRALLPGTRESTAMPVRGTVEDSTPS